MTMNNYQPQQFWNDINGITGFAIQIILVGLMAGMVKGVVGGESSESKPESRKLGESKKLGGKSVGSKTIWVGKFTDEQGEFEILVVASNRGEAYEFIDKALSQLIKNPEMVSLSDRITGTPTPLYVEEVGTFDMVRPR